MPEPYVSDRIIFLKKGQQKDFILEVKTRLNLTWVDLAKLFGHNSHTVRAWSKEEFKMSYKLAIDIALKTHIDLPEGVVSSSWESHIKKISAKGGENKFKKYGKVVDEKIRRKAWDKWWSTKGKYSRNKIFDRLPIRIPPRNSDLAEFIGIMIGDGGITPYKISITTDKVADAEYILFLSKFIFKLFNIIPKIYKLKARAINIVINRRDLVLFCEKSGLKVGNKLKQNLDIPAWIKKNKEFCKSCIRGLVDTDGCFFEHTYKVNGKSYTYLKIAFTSRSTQLIQSVRDILINLGFCVRMSKNGNDVRIDSQKDVERYMNIIGTSNPKHNGKFLRRRVGVV